LGVDHALAFDAHRLSSIVAADFIMNLTKSVVINGFQFESALEKVLKVSSPLGNHTSVLHIANTVIKYTWAHRHIRPYGQHIPVQCEVCGALSSFSGAWSTLVMGYVFQCANRECGVTGGMRIRPAYSFIICRPANVELLLVGAQSESLESWMKIVVA
jgi:hypothetical protein